MKAASAIAIAGFLAFTLLGRSFSDQQATDQPKQADSRTVECRWLKGQLDFDGVINEPSWAAAETIELSVPWEKRKSKTATKARLLWDRDYLYFCAEMEDNDLYADIVTPNGKLWENDVFELFFKPTAKSLGYYEFQVNAANTPLQIYLPSRGAGGYRRFASDTQEFQFQAAVKLNGTLNDWSDKDKGWNVEGRISWDAFKPTGGRPKAGDRWRFAPCRYDYSVTLDNPELSTNAPLTAPDFHRYEEWQELVFVERK